MKRNSDDNNGMKIVICLVIGATMGCLVSVLHHVRHVPAQAKCSALMEKYAALERENEQLRGEIKLEEQVKEDSQKELAYYGQQSKEAGPFGTVKGIRTNPAVVPNDMGNQRLAELLKNIAVNKELVVAVADSNIAMLRVWTEQIQRVGITNYLVVAQHDEVFTFCKENRVHVIKRDSEEKAESVGEKGSNSTVSGPKFRILREFLELGYAVLLSDIDVVFLQNPFRRLYRDCDVESMSDGHTNETVYGFDQSEDNPEMGWGRYVHTMKISVYDSGFFYVRPTVPSFELLDRVAVRVSTERAWDQQAYNEELFFPSHPRHVGLHASRRTMDMYEFMNSKTLFKVVRLNPELMKLKPVVVRVNSHPDKIERIKAVVDCYVMGNKDALMAFPLETE